MSRKKKCEPPTFDSVTVSDDVVTASPCGTVTNYEGTMHDFFDDNWGSVES